MSNETKWDVFEELLDAYDDVKSSDGNLHPTQELLDYDDRYDNALPDDLPLIPKAVSEYIKWGKPYDIQLYMMYVSQLIHRPGFKKLTDDAKSWIISSSNIFARAWLLGVWRVEETGEIVKLEAEK